MSNPRHWIIRGITPWIWKLLPGRQLTALQQFSIIEKDSGIQLLHGMPLIDEPKLKAHVFQHVLEEFHHGEMFEDLCQRLSDKHLYTKIKPRERMLSSDASREELADFFSYVHVGEMAVNRDFVEYAKTSLPGHIRGVFRAAGLDEGRHEKDTGDIVLDICGGNSSMRDKKVCAAWWTRRWRLYKQAMHEVGGLSLTIILSLVYFVLGWIAAPTLRRRLNAKPEEQLEIFREQVMAFEKEFD